MHVLSWGKSFFVFYCKTSFFHILRGGVWDNWQKKSTFYTFFFDETTKYFAIILLRHCSVTLEVS